MRQCKLYSEELWHWVIQSMTGFRGLFRICSVLWDNNTGRMYWDFQGKHFFNQSGIFGLQWSISWLCQRASGTENNGCSGLSDDNTARVYWDLNSFSANQEIFGSQYSKSWLCQHASGTAKNWGCGLWDDNAGRLEQFSANQGFLDHSGGKSRLCQRASGTAKNGCSSLSEAEVSLLAKLKIGQLL